MTTTRFNRLLGTDTQPKAAASRHGLRAGQRQRYAALMGDGRASAIDPRRSFPVWDGAGRPEGAG